MTVQAYVPGRPVASPAAAAAEAGDAPYRLPAGSRGALREAPPEGQLEMAAASARLVGQIAPRLRGRLEVLLGRLAATIPRGLEPVQTHGDFNARQLIDAAGELVVTDFDAMGAAPGALDLATHFSYPIRGDPSDLDHAMPVLDTLLDGYGERPEELSWYLAAMVLRRSPRPFRYQDVRWPERIEQMVAVAERVGE